MVKKKSPTSAFTNLARQASSQSTTAECHLIDNEYFAAFDTLDDIQEFQKKIIDKQQTDELSDEEDEMDMKTFAKKYLIDLPEASSGGASSANSRNKRQRRDIRDLPQSSNFIFMSDDESENIFESLKEKRSSSACLKRIAYDDMERILVTLDVKQKKTKATTCQEDDESIVVKNEPIEQEQLVIAHVVEAKDEPVEINVIPTGPMGFGTPEFSGVLDTYVQNIHRSCATNVSIASPSSAPPPAPPLPIETSSRPKRIRKQKRFYIEETESMIPPKRVRRKRQPSPPVPMLTDAEIEQQFGERLSPVIKSEENTESNQLQIEIVPQTPMEIARAKLTHALERKRNRSIEGKSLNFDFRWFESRSISLENSFS